jgi:hypothetical protein
MARAQREPFGHWSLTQVAAEAGITPRTARTLVASNVLNLHRLGYKDVLVARVAAALLDAPRPAGLNRTEAAAATQARDTQAIAYAREVIDTPAPSADTRLAIFPDEVRLVTESMKIFGAIGDMDDRPLLLLPVGKWALALRESLLPPTSAEAS